MLTGTLESDVSRYFPGHRRSDDVRVRIPIKSVAVADAGGNSFKLTGYITKERNSKLVLIPVIKRGAQCAIGGNVSPNDPHPTLRDEGMNLALTEVIPKWQEDCEKQKFHARLKIAIGTEPFRAVDLLGTDAEKKKMEDFIVASSEEFGMHPDNFTIASERLEAHLSAEAAVLANFTDGIVFMVGGNSIQITHLKNGKIVKDHWAVLRIGSRSIRNIQNIPEVLLEELAKIPWLTAALKDTNKIMILGGTYRGTGRLAAYHFDAIDYLSNNMPFNGYPFPWFPKSPFDAFVNKLRCQTDDNLFVERFGNSAKELLISPKKNGKISVLINGKEEKVDKEDLIRIRERFQDKIGDRAPSLPFVIPLLRTFLDYHYNLVRSSLEARIGPVSIRDALAARATGATCLSYT